MGNIMLHFRPDPSGPVTFEKVPMSVPLLFYCSEMELRISVGFFSWCIASGVEIVEILKANVDL